MELINFIKNKIYNYEKNLNKKNFCLLESRMMGNYHVRFGGQSIFKML
jgi:hypothetical protein